MSVLDEIISKAFDGDFWAVLDFSPSVFLVVDIVMLLNGFHSKMLNIMSQIIKTVCPFGCVLSTLV